MELDKKSYKIHKHRCFKFKDGSWERRFNEKYILDSNEERNKYLILEKKLELVELLAKLETLEAYNSNFFFCFFFNFIIIGSNCLLGY